MGNLLCVKNLSKTFKTKDREFNAVDNVSFEVKHGEVLGLVGESGCGKTTLGRTIIKIYPPSSGEIYLEDKLICGPSLSKHQNKRIVKDIQMIFQDPMSSLNPRMTVREIISEGLVINGEKNKKVIQDKVNEMLSYVGLSYGYRDRYPHEFSGGQRQRIGIARALIVSPKLLIADEPVSALDVSVQAQVINLLEDLRERLGLTVLFIAHDLAVVKHFSDRIAVMHKGRIIESANSDELFKNPQHLYTKSLLSAIPLPDPHYEKTRKRIIYTGDEPYSRGRLLEVAPKHFVFSEDKA